MPKFKGLLSIGVDEVSNTIVISAPAYLMQVISKMVLDLDEAAPPVQDTMAVVKIGSGVSTTQVEESLSRVLGQGEKRSRTPRQPQAKPGENGLRPRQRRRRRPNRGDRAEVSLQIVAGTRSVPATLESNRLFLALAVLVETGWFRADAYGARNACGSPCRPRQVTWGLLRGPANGFRRRGVLAPSENTPPRQSKSGAIQRVAGVCSIRRARDSRITRRFAPLLPPWVGKETWTALMIPRAIPPRSRHRIAHDGHRVGQPSLCQARSRKLGIAEIDLDPQKVHIRLLRGVRPVRTTPFRSRSPLQEAHCGQKELRDPKAAAGFRTA